MVSTKYYLSYLTWSGFEGKYSFPLRFEMAIERCLENRECLEKLYNQVNRPPTLHNENFIIKDNCKQINCSQIAYHCPKISSFYSSCGVPVLNSFNCINNDIAKCLVDIWTENEDAYWRLKEVRWLEDFKKNFEKYIRHSKVLNMLK